MIFFILQVILVVLTLLLTYAAVRWLDADGTEKYLTPELDRFGPYSLAALDGGAARLIQTAVFSLYRQGMVELVEIDSENVLRISKKAPANLCPTEQLVYDAMAEKDCFFDHDLWAFENDETLGKHLAEIYAELKRSHLIRDDAEIRRTRIKAIVAGVVLFTLIALLYNLLHSEIIPAAIRRQSAFPEVLSVIMGLFQLLAILVILLSLKQAAGKYSGLGSNYVALLHKQYMSLKNDFMNGKTLSHADALHLVAIWGLSWLRQSDQCKGLACIFARKSRMPTN